MNLPALRLPQYAVERVNACTDSIRPLVRMQSDALTTACRQHGLPIELSELCGGLLASVVDDLAAIPKLARTDFERTKRMVRVTAAAREPALFALRIAIAASPINGEAAVRHWDAICEPSERGRLAWLVGLETEASYHYGKRMEKRA